MSFGNLVHGQPGWASHSRSLTFLIDLGRLVFAPLGRFQPAPHLSGFPYREVRFNADGHPVDQHELDAVNDLAAQESITNVIIISHGCNIDIDRMRLTYADFAEHMRNTIGRVQLDKSKTALWGCPGLLFRWSMTTLQLVCVQQPQQISRI